MSTQIPPKSVVLKALEQASFEALRRTTTHEQIAYIDDDLFDAARTYGLLKGKLNDVFWRFRGMPVRPVRSKAAA